MERRFSLVPLAAWNAVAWLALAGSAFVASALIFRSLGAGNYGIWAFVVAARGLLLVLDGGIAMTAARDTAARGAEAQAHGRLVATRWLAAASGLVVLGLGIAVAPVPAALLGLTGSQAAHASLLTLLVAAEASLALATGPFLAMLRGLERYDLIAASALAQSLVGLAALALFIPQLGLAGAGAGLLLGRFVGAAVAYVWIRKRTPELLALPSPSVRALATVSRFAFPIWLVAVGSQLAIHTDVPIVGSFYGPVVASHYALGAVPAALAAGLLFVALDVVYARLSALWSDAAAALVRETTLFGCGLAGLGFGSLVLHGSAVIETWVGDAPPLALAVLTVYALAWTLNVPTHILAIAAIGRGHHGVLAPIVLAESLANLTLSVALAAFASPLGPAIASLAVLAVSNGAVIPAVLAPRLGLRASTVLMVSLLGFIPGVALAAVVRLVTAAMPLPVPFIAVVGAVGTGLAAVALLAMLRGLEGPFARLVAITQRGGAWVWLRQRAEARAARSRLRSLRERFPIVWRRSDPPLVTIRIATYDRGPLVAERAIASALGQTHRNVEVVVVGDDCDEATVRAVLAVHDPRIRFENLPRRGEYPAEPELCWMVAGTAPMNRATDLARGEWIAPLDDDDEFTPDHVEVLLSACLERRLEFAYGVAETEVRPGEWRRVGSWPPRQGKLVHASVLYWARIPLRHDIEAWRLDEPGDWNLWRRMRDAGVRMGFVDRVVCRHYLERREIAR